MYHKCYNIWLGQSHLLAETRSYFHWLFKTCRITFVLAFRSIRTVYNLRNVILRSQNDNGPACTAYLVKKKLAKSTYGSVRLCIVLKRKSRRTRLGNESRQDTHNGSHVDEVEWESTDDVVVVKTSEWSKVHAMRGRHLEDPIKEISAMQLMGNYHPHVIGAIEVLQDDDFLYTVMPYLPNGDLYERLLENCPWRQKSKNPEGDSYGFEEKQARTWFRHLVLVSPSHLSCCTF